MSVFRLPSGKSMMPVEIPDGFNTEVIEVENAGIIEDPAGAARQALREPFDFPSLKDIAKKFSGALVIVSDKTRVTGASIFLPVLVEELVSAGINPEKIELLVAYGTHPVQSDSESERIYGKELLSSGPRLSHHDPDSPGLAETGPLPDGSTVRINRKVAEHVEADRMLVLTGSVNLHYHAGFGGGRKAIMPGVASREDVYHNHRALLTGEPYSVHKGRHPGCRPGNIENNPVHEMMENAAGIVKPDFLLNTLVLSETQWLGVFTGDWRRAFSRAARSCFENFTRSIPKQFDIVIASAGGYPKDIDLYQAHKALDNACRACKPGGTVVLFAECIEGAGGPPGAFDKWAAYPTVEEHFRALSEGPYEVAGQTFLAFREKCERNRVLVVTRLPVETTSALGAEQFETAERAVSAALGGAVSGTDILIMPHAAAVLPLVGGKVPVLF